MALAADIIGYLSGLTLAGGDHDGQPFIVLPWERRFVTAQRVTAGSRSRSPDRRDANTSVPHRGDPAKPRQSPIAASFLERSVSSSGAPFRSEARGVVGELGRLGVLWQPASWLLRRGFRRCWLMVPGWGGSDRV